MSQTPIYQIDHRDTEKAQSFNCVSWVRDAVERLGQAGKLSGLQDWDSIQKEALDYAKMTKGKGKWEAGTVASDVNRTPIKDLLAGTELLC